MHRLPMVMSPPIFVPTLKATVFLCLLMAPAVAAVELPDDPPPPPGPVVSLEHAQLIDLLLLHSPELARVRMSLRERESERRSTDGAWEPILSAEAGVSNSRSPVAQGITRGIASSERYELRSSISQRFRAGTAASLSLSNALTRSSIPIRIEGFSDTIEQGPDLEVGLTLQITQPLLQGAGRRLGELPMRLATLRRDTDLLVLGREASARTTEALVAHAELAWAWDHWLIRMRSVQRTRRQLDIASAQVQAGRVAAVDLDVTRQRIAAALEAAWTARGALIQRSDALVRTLGLDITTTTYAARMADEGQIELPDEIGVACEAAALASPDLAVLEAQVNVARAALQGSRDPLRPRLDATAAVTQSGLDEQFAAAWGQMFRLEARTLFAGLLFSMPLGNSAAVEEHARAELAVERARFEVDDATRQICHQINDLYRQRETLAEREGLAAIRVELASRAVEAEEERFARGLGTVQLGLEASEALEEAELAQLRVLTDRRMLDIQLAHLLGLTLLDTLGGLETVAAAGSAP